MLDLDRRRIGGAGGRSSAGDARSRASAQAGDRAA